MFRKIFDEEVYSEYDLFGNIVNRRIIDHESKYNPITKESYEYDDKNNLVYHTKSNSEESYTKYEYDEKGNLSFSEFQYKSGKKVFKKTYEYDNRNNIIYTKEDNYLKSPKYLESWYRYDDKNNLIEYKNSNGRYEIYKYDINGNLIYKRRDEMEYLYKYNENGKLLIETYIDCNIIKMRDEYKYDSEGRIIRIKHFSDEITLYDYENDHKYTVYYITADSILSGKCLYNYKYDMNGNEVYHKFVKYIL